MAKIYCSQAGCGFVSTYEVTKPRFCGSCGKSYSSAFATSIPVSQPQKPVTKKTIKPTVADVDDDFDDTEEIDGEIAAPSISDFVVNIRPKFTMGQLVKQETPIVRGKQLEQLPADVDVSSTDNFKPQF